jgi:hypothetical protein
MIGQPDRVRHGTAPFAAGASPLRPQNLPMKGKTLETLVPLPLVGPERYRQSAKATKMPTRQRVTFLSDPTEMRLGYIVK